ncbi:MAG: DegT/DnrJ/EryC1/StrS aminotransferase family protein [Candidatus Omnitrophica bacterium]|nr:DegT/DnrJ/EryC1/StrS aminotransferase family protein [Candidatus Omnitrophota bacterium]
MSNNQHQRNVIEHSCSTIGKEERDAVIKVLKTNYLAEGQDVRRFEKEMCEYIGGKGAVATSTGTLALHLALACLGIEKNDEIIVPSYVCRSVLNAVLSIGARPVVVDVNIDDYNISFSCVRKKVSKKTKAIIVAHMFGCPAEIDQFRDLGVPIIEDCAHAIGAEYKGKKVGSWGDLAIFSFEGTKYIITGEGGMVIANSRRLFNKLKKLKEPNSRDSIVKYTYRMTNLQAAIGRVQLARLENFISKRKKIVKMYNKAFSKTQMQLPVEYQYAKHVFHRYMVKINYNIRKYMNLCCRQGVNVKQPVKPYSLHKYLELSDYDFPNTRHIMKSAVSLPIYPSLTKKQVQYIIKVSKKALLKLECEKR